MKITIPEKYLEHFRDSNCYMCRWKGPSVLLMNEDDRNNLHKQLDGSQLKPVSGIVRFIKAGINEVDFDEGVIDIPEFLIKWLSKNELSYKEHDFGLIIS